MEHVSHKLKNAFEGALAGGGDPATSPLYVFGPFLKMLAAAGVAAITYGDSIWLVIITIAAVSAVYRYVMRWITDGSGGSGLCEDEFGKWAVKINAALTFVEDALTFLVSMSALVTFLADRFPLMHAHIIGLPISTLTAISLSLMIGFLVNRGPRLASRVFGPATAGVLLLLWMMIIAAIAKTGFHLPPLTLRGFSPGYLHYTISGYVRILAVMTGIEVFANLVAAYSGTDQEKTRKAFGSLSIIMATTIVTMLIVGPAIFSLADPANVQVSVFTQAMDQLLPQPIAYFGSFVSIIVLMSACAASAQGLQHLSSGLAKRRYLPHNFGKTNRFGVADKPVWLQVLISSLSYLTIGTNEETYLGLYAVGVFVILSLTAWAVFKRLSPRAWSQLTLKRVAVLLGIIIAALLTTTATLVIFIERFLEGAWLYFILIPILFLVFTHYYTRNSRTALTIGTDPAEI